MSCHVQESFKRGSVRFKEGRIHGLSWQRSVVHLSVTSVTFRGVASAFAYTLFPKIAFINLVNQWTFICKSFFEKSGS